MKQCFVPSNALQLKNSSYARIPSLDGLRAISILLVVFGHSASTYHHSNHWLNALLIVGGNAELGVLIFFVISGFLITTLLLRENEKTGRINLYNFYLRRAFRIFPAFYCYMGVILCLWMAGTFHLNWPAFATAALFLRNYSAPFVHIYPPSDWFIGHTWTLAVEEQFYWLWPLCLVIAKPRYAAIVAIVLIVVDPFIRTAEYFLFPSTRDFIPIMLHTRVDSLMIGCLIALLYKNVRFQEKLNLCYKRNFPLLAAIFVFCLSPFLAAHFRGIYLLPVGWTLENICVALILLWAIDHSKSAIGKLLNSKPLVHLGIISYSLYLWQQLFLTNQSPISFDKFPLSILLAICAAEISYFVVERPVLSWRKKIRPVSIGSVTQQTSVDTSH